ARILARVARNSLTPSPTDLQSPRLPKRYASNPRQNPRRRLRIVQTVEPSLERYLSLRRAEDEHFSRCTEHRFNVAFKLQASISFFACLTVLCPKKKKKKRTTNDRGSKRTKRTMTLAQRRAIRNAREEGSNE